MKEYDEPQTPFARLINSEKLSQEEKQALLARREHLNPFGLRNELEKKLKWYIRIVDIRKKQSRETGS